MIASTKKKYVDPNIVLNSFETTEALFSTHRSDMLDSHSGYHEFTSSFARS